MQTSLSLSIAIANSVFAEWRITEIVWREFQAVGPATENARRPNLVRRCRGAMSWWRLAERSRWRLATSVVDLQHSTRYWGALPCRHRWTVTPSLNCHVRQKRLHLFIFCNSFVKSSSVTTIFAHVYFNKFPITHLFHILYMFGDGEPA